MPDTLIETGLSAPAVNQPPAALPAPVPATPPAPLPTDWDAKRAFAFMRDVAQEMFPLDSILKKHAVTPEQYAEMQGNDYFKRTMAAMVAEWNTAANTPKRLALEALIALEGRLPDVVARMSSKTEPLASVVQLASFLAKIGGLGEQAQTAGPSEKFKITINLGADVEKFEKERRPVINVEATTVRPVTEGEAAAQEIRRITFGPGEAPQVQ